MTLHTTVNRVVFNTTTFTHPRLSEEEMRNGCRIGIDSFADTCVAGKHAHVIDFIEGKEISAKAWDGHKTQNLRIANVAYAFDTPDGETIILIFNQSIYGGEIMDDSLANPIQCLQNDVKIDCRPSIFYPDDDDAQTIQFEGQRISIQYDGPLPYLNVRRPTADEWLNCTHYEMTSRSEWNPYSKASCISTLNAEIDQDGHVTPNSCGISSKLLPEADHYSSLLQQRDICLFYSKGSGEEHYRSTNAVASRAKEKLSPEKLASMWGIGIKTAKRTLKATTHRCVKTIGDLTRRFRTDKAHMRYKRLTTKHGKFYVDTLKSKVKSIRGNTCGNLYTNDLGFRKFFPMITESQTPSTLQTFIVMVGLPPALHADNAKVFVEGDVKRKCQKYGIEQSFTEPHSPWMNRAETGIREVKAFGRRLLQSKQAPIRLWCFAYEYAAEICCLLATGLYDLGGRTPYEIVMQHTPDISEYVVFEWYQWAYYWDEIDKEKKLCRWLGVTGNVGQAMCYHVLLSNGEFIARSTVIPIPDEDLNVDSLKEQMDNFTQSLHEVIGDHTKAIVRGEILAEDEVYYDAFFDTSEDDKITWPWETELEELPLSDENEVTLEELDQYINANVVLPGRDGLEVLAQVKGRKRDHNGKTIGTANSNPILDTRVYHVEFPDGHTEEYATNKIAEALYDQLDEDGYNTGLVQEICDHQRSECAVGMAEGYAGEGSKRKPVITTKGWKLQVKWTDGSFDWLPLSQVKESNPIETAEYAIAHGIHKEPAFNWWVPHVIRKRDRIINKVTHRTRKANMKFGIVIPSSVDEAYQIDSDNGNTFWAESIKKEMDSVNHYKTFKILEDDVRMYPGFQEVTCHMVFDVKFDLRRKSRYVAGGHLVKEQPKYNTYSSVVSRESVRIGFLLAALNDIDIMAGDIANAYLNAKTKEKVWFRAGTEFGDDRDKRVIIVKALYGLPGSGNAWRSTLADVLKNYLKYQPSLADPDVWYKAETKANGETYYSYILCYVDDVLIVHETPAKIMAMLESKYTLKFTKPGDPIVYLGANIQKIDSKTPGKECWGASAEQYVREAVNNVKQQMKKDGFQFNKKLSDPKYSPQQPFSAKAYRPELDTSLECNDVQGTYYQNLIGVLRWVVELGRIDINYEVSVLSQYLCNPRTGHLAQALHVFKYLDIHKENFICFDPTYVDLEEPVNDLNSPETRARVMKEFYPDAEEKIPPNAPEPRGKPVQINCFVDADHAGNVVTRRSHTGILVFLNMAPIHWYSRRQNCVESSTFSSEFIALKTAMETIAALRYKLRMFGVPIEGPARVFCDNEAVYRNTSDPASTLKKRHQSVAYHICRESVAAGAALIYKEDGETNLSDLLTKSTHTRERRIFLRERIMVYGKVKSTKDT